MHGTGCFTQLIMLSGGGCTVTLEARNLDIDELLDTIEREGSTPSRSWATPSPSRCSAPSTPSPGKYDISSLFMISSARA